MAKKFYLSRNATRPIKAGTKDFTFELCALTAGTFYGTFSTEDKDDQKLLEDHRLVEEITENDFDFWQKKKLTFQATNFSRSKPLGLSHVRSASPAAAKASVKKDEPVEKEDLSNTDHSGEDLEATEAVETDLRVISYKDLAKALDVDIDWLKKAAKRDDAPKRDNKGFLVSDWEAFATKLQNAETVAKSE